MPWARLQYLEPLAPGGGIDADLDEMAHYALLQIGDGTIFGQQVLSARMMSELHRREIAVDDDWSPTARADDLHYALGWFTAETRGAHLIFHFGGNPGFRAVAAVVPSARAAVVILTNGESNHFTSTAMASLVARLLGPSTGN